MNKKAALLSMNSLKNFYTYDKLLIEPMSKLGWDAEEISWRNEDVDWNDYAAVIVRSTWDYQNDSEKFLNVLVSINNSSAHLENDLELMKWNMNKNYLFDLEKKGVRIVNTIWETSFNPNNAYDYFNKLSSEEIIIKPNISANADNTFRLSKEKLIENMQKLEQVFAQRDFMVQPFMQNIVDEGEYSLFYFNGVFSHAVLKKPKENDFRVQEEHGGIFKSIDPTEQQKSIAEKIVNKLPVIPLYARTDLVRTKENDFALIELELIEPSLYFNMDSLSPERFANAFNNRMKNLSM
jgi:glutathione synthase/RimK-type ligase-like ATP-grasp enzyme